MKCSRCSKNAVIPSLCKEHFIRHFELNFKRTIENYGLLSGEDKVCVAASGGKDSTTVLYLIHKLIKPRQLQALIIDEGIKGYRDKTLSDLRRFCDDYGIALKVISFKDEFGRSLDEIIRSKRIGLKPCTICGTLRRYLLNKYSRGFDVIATGHNLDDEAQAVMMNIFRAQMDVLARLGPKSGISRRKHFVQRVKPLYFCSEKEVALYAVLMGFNVSFNECPYIVHSYRADVRDFLNDYEVVHKGAKGNVIAWFLKRLPLLKTEFAGEEPNICDGCGEPSSNNICNACKLVKRM